MSHDCIFETDDDALAEAAMTLERCRCHENVWSAWKVGDPPHRCPTTGRTRFDQAPEVQE